MDDLFKFLNISRNIKVSELNKLDTSTRLEKKVKEKLLLEFENYGKLCSPDSFSDVYINYLQCYDFILMISEIRNKYNITSDEWRKKYPTFY